MITRDLKEKLPEDNLVTRLKQGDEKAYDQLFKEMYPVLCLYTYNLIQNEQEAQCIVAETFEKLWKLHSSFEAISSIKAFLYKVCYREGVDYLKYGLKRQSANIDTVKDLQYEPSDKEDFLTRMIQNEMVNRIYEEINKLSPQRRQVLQLFYRDDLNTKEIAERLNMKEDLIRTIKAQALQQIRKQLGITINSRHLTLLLILALQWEQVTPSGLASVLA